MKRTILELREPLVISVLSSYRFAYVLFPSSIFGCFPVKENTSMAVMREVSATTAFMLPYHLSQVL